MSLTRASNHLRRWPRRSSQRQICLPPVSSSTSLNRHRVFPHDNRPFPNKNRPFHSTAPCNAARSPLARDKQDEQLFRRSGSSNLLFYRLQGDWRVDIKHIKDVGKIQFHKARNNGFLSRSISERTFLNVAEKLVNAAYSEPPSARAIRKISTDVDTVFAIGTLATKHNEKTEIRNWVFAACTHAGAQIPVIAHSNQYLLRTTSHIPRGIDYIDKLEEIASSPVGPESPAVHLIAKCVHARVLGRRGEYTKALAYMEEVMSKIKPTRISDYSLLEDFLKDMEPPWDTYAWLKEMTGDHTGTDETLKMAALEFEDPGALVNYATIMMQERNYEMYEECMSKAAEAGNFEACRKLANFYYLTFHGRFPRRGEKEVAKEEDTKEKFSLKSYIGSFFGQIRPREEYRTLAQEWYFVAGHNGRSPAVALILACIAREDGLVASGFDLLETAEKSAPLKKLAMRFKLRWGDPDFDPNIPSKLLDV